MRISSPSLGFVVREVEVDMVDIEYRQEVNVHARGVRFGASRVVLKVRWVMVRREGE